MSPHTITASATIPDPNMILFADVYAILHDGIPQGVKITLNELESIFYLVKKQVHVRQLTAELLAAESQEREIIEQLNRSAVVVKPAIIAEPVIVAATDNDLDESPTRPYARQATKKRGFSFVSSLGSDDDNDEMEIDSSPRTPDTNVNSENPAHSKVNTVKIAESPRTPEAKIKIEKARRAGVKTAVKASPVLQALLAPFETITGVDASRKKARKTT